MSRRNPSTGEILLQLPWQVSGTLAVMAYIGLRWILPAIERENPLFKTVVPTFAQLAWLPALCLGMTAVCSAVLAKRKRALLDEQKDAASLRDLSWKEFEWLVGEAYRRQGYGVEESLGGGADGGIDLILRKDGGTWLVQCKQWKVHSVGAPVIREIFGLVAHHRACGAMVITSGRFTREAEAFAAGKPIELIDGPKLLELVKAVQNSRSSPAAEVAALAATAPPPVPVTAPTCPSCGASMVKRVARKGANAGNSFWGCLSYPSCNGVRNP